MKRKAHIRIAGTIILAAIVIAVSYTLSHRETSLPTPPTDTNLHSEADIERNYISTTDTDNNGIPDWQDALVLGVINLDEIDTTAPYEPQTETGKLALSIKDAINATTENGRSLIADAFSDEKVKATQALMADEPVTRNELTIVADNTNSLRYYGDRVVAITYENSPTEALPTELSILNTALRTQDETQIAKLDLYIASYEGMFADTLATPVPESMVNEQLALLNVYRGLTNNAKAFRQVFSDAIPTLVRLQRYPSDTIALYTAYQNIYRSLNDAGIQWEEGSLVSSFIKVE